MKKSSTILLCMISLMISLAFSLYNKEKDIEYIENIDRVADSFDIFVKNSDLSTEEALDSLKKLSKKYNASIIRTDEIYEDNQVITHKSGLFSPNYFKNLKIKLKTGRLPKNEHEYISTYSMNSSRQVGVINDLFQDTPLKFNYLPNYINEKALSIDGKYNVVVQERTKFLEELSADLKIEQETLSEIPYLKVYNLSGAFFILVFLLLISIVILILVNFFKPLTNLKMIGILKLQGYSNWDAVKESNKNHWIAPLLTVVLSIPFLYLFVENMTITFFFGWISSQFLVFIIHYLCLFISLLIIRKYKLSHIINNYFSSKISLYSNYTCKFLVFSLLIVILPILSSGISTMKKNMDAQNLYEEQKKYVTLSNYTFVNNEFQDSLNNNKTLGTKALSLFKDLEKSSEAEYFFAEKLFPIHLKIENTERFATTYFEEQEHYYVVQANLNYIKNLKLDLTKDFQKEAFNLLIPIKQQGQIDHIEGLIRPHINSYIEDNKKYKLIDEIPISVIYYTNSEIEIFSNNIDLISENKGLISQPIFLLMDDYSLTPYNSRLLDGPMSNPLKIVDSEKNLENIQQAIYKNNLQDNNMQFSNAFDSGYHSELRDMKIGVIAFTSVLLLALIVSTLSSFYISAISILLQKKEFLVTRFLGYPFFDRYKNQFFNILIIYTFGLVESFLLGKDTLSIFIYLILVSLDFSIFYAILIKQDKLLLSTSLKGGYL